MAEKPSQKPVVLVIDDSVEVIELLRMKFGRRNTLHTAFNGEQGLAMAREKKPDLVLLDINMPGRNGFQVLRELRSEDAARETVIIMLTAQGEPDFIAKALDLGANDYIVKPFSIIELSARVNSHLTIKRLQRELLDMERLKTLREVAVAFSHEINNPLMSINTFAWYLKQQAPGLEERAGESIEGILREAAVISRKVKKLAEATRAASVEYGPGIKMIDIGRVGGDD